MSCVSPTSLAKALFLFRCAIGGFIDIYLPKFWNDIGLTPVQIGTIGSFGLAAGVLSSPILGGIVDASREWRKRFLIGLTVVGFLTYASLIPIALLPSDALFVVALAVCTLNQFAGASVTSLLDAIVVGLVPQNAYGKLRLWCSVGYGASAGAVGLITILVEGQGNTASDGTPTNETKVTNGTATNEVDWMPYITHFVPGLVCSFTLLVLTIFLQDSPKMSTNEGDEDVGMEDFAKRSNHSSSESVHLDSDSEEQMTKEYPILSPVEAEGFCTKLSRVPFSLDLLLFVIIILCCGAYMGLVATFLFIFIEKTLNGTELIMGLSVLVNCISEVPVFFFSDKVLNKVSPDWAIAVSLIAYTIRFGLYWLFAALSVNPAFILFSEALHGITFALMWSAAISKVTEMMAKINLINFGVGLITAIFGSGTAMGALLAGSMLGVLGMLDIWMGATCLAAGLTVIWVFYLWLTSYLNKKKGEVVPTLVEGLPSSSSSS